MTQWILRSKRKITSGLVGKHSKRQKHKRGRDYLPGRVEDKRVKVRRTKGGGEKRTALGMDIANVTSKGKTQKSKILSVLENSADVQFTRRNIITKGAIIQTELGAARVTSRPGQAGFVNATLLEGYKAPVKKKKAKKKA